MFKTLVFVIAIALASGLTSLSVAQSDSGSAALINVNRATAQQLADALDGVGLARAQAIVQYRDNYGTFDKVDELLMVSGIGPNILEVNRSRITLE